MSSLLDRHPGGRSVLIAGLCRDISADFRHVPAHERAGIGRQLSALVIAELEPRGGLAPRWAALADHILLVRNGFLVQETYRRTAPLSLVYLGQSYAHLVADHLADIEAQLHTLGGTGHQCPATSQTQALDAIEHALTARHEPDAAVLVDRIRARTAQLLNGLLQLASVAANPDTALRHAADWRSEENDYWNSLRSRHRA